MFEQFLQLWCSIDYACVEKNFMNSPINVIQRWTLLRNEVQYSVTHDPLLKITAVFESLFSNTCQVQSNVTEISKFVGNETMFVKSG